MNQITTRNKWQTHEFSEAIAASIHQSADHRFTSERNGGNELRFNAFWRKGDSSNVCLYRDRAIVRDFAREVTCTCKDFAQLAFNMKLPDFMERFGNITPSFKLIHSTPQAKPRQAQTSVDNIWQELIKRDALRHHDRAGEWLEKKRGFKNSRGVIRSGYANLYEEDARLFDNTHQNFIKSRTGLGQQMVVPLRGTDSAEVLNLYLRSFGEVPKDEKSRLLPNSGGWGTETEGPRAFGFPHLIINSPTVIICEGMADYFAAEYLTKAKNKFLPIGASNAGALPKWARWLIKSGYKGRVVWLYQLDKNKEGKVSASGIGQQKAAEASKLLSTAGIESELFKWAPFLATIPNLQKIPTDMAEVFELTNNKKI